MVLVPKIYSEELKASALELLDQGMTQKQVCQDLGMSKSALQAWVNESRLRERGFEPARGPSAGDGGEQTRMLKRIRELVNRPGFAGGSGHLIPTRASRPCCVA